MLMFDYDGTLSDSIGQLHAFYDHLCEAHGKDKPFADAVSFKAWFAEPFTEVYERLGFDWKRDAHMLQDEFRSFREREPPVLGDGVLELIEELTKRGIPLSIASNGFEDQIREELGSYGILARFSSVRGIKSITDPIKPEPYLLLDAAAQAGFTVSETIYIGDTVSDIIAAQAAGMRAVAITTGLHTRSQLEAHEPEHVFDHPSEILGLVEKEFWERT